jgi:hypothetical protein
MSVVKSNREKVSRLDEIGVTAFMIWFIENYPESFKEMKENPEVHERLRRGDENVS